MARLHEISRVKCASGVHAVGALGRVTPTQTFRGGAASAPDYLES